MCDIRFTMFIHGNVTVGSLVAERQTIYLNLEDGVHVALSAAFAKDYHYTLFRHEDCLAWVTFAVIIAGLLLFDNVILHRNTRSLSMATAVLYSFFWIACAFCFCCGIYIWYGASKAFMWGSGYMLEWMLSFDNLFVFHVIFSVYGTPTHLKHRPLSLGIWGAIFFRLGFIFLGEYLLHTLTLLHLVFGVFLIYTGWKTAWCDDEDGDPSQHWIVQWLQSKFAFVSVYDDNGSFVVRVWVDEEGTPHSLKDGKAVLPDPSNLKKSSNDLSEANTESRVCAKLDALSSTKYGTIDFSQCVAMHDAQPQDSGEYQWRMTMLFLVVVCIEISDLLFAMDSVSAIVAQVNDLYLAYTSTVFAMIGLRATFFIVDNLVTIFAFLRYGVATVLVFIGTKLIIERIIYFHPALVCIFILSVIMLSILASIIQMHYGCCGDREDQENDDLGLSSS